MYDLGGRTFDISILEIAPDNIAVLSTNGDSHLGGDDFDQVIIKWIQDEFKRSEGLVRKDPLALVKAAERPRLSCHFANTEINQPFITSDANGLNIW